MQNLIVLMEPSEEAFDISLKGVNMIFNRFCIDEDAAFEFSGINYFEEPFVEKEHFDETAIDSTIQKITEKEAKELKIHFVCAGGYYFLWAEYFIRKRMKKYNIKSVMVTFIDIERLKLITKEAMENYCKGEEHEKVSVNDDLELLFEDLRLGKQPNEHIRTYFLPKLTVEEMKFVQRKDTTYLETIYFSNPDVEEAEMMLSESDSKFVQGLGRRRTFIIKNESYKSKNRIKKSRIGSFQ